MQLAVVTALGGLSKRSIWVGDRKQAIFGFQGSDPDLMSAAMQSVLEKRPPALLSTSYRSRPPLVELVSALFAEALEPHGFPREQVVLTPARPDPAELEDQPALECWRWTPETAEDESGKVSSRATEAAAVAAGVEALLAKPPLVRERVEGGEDRLRPAARRDVAVLAFVNSRCRAIAKALRARVSRPCVPRRARPRASLPPRRSISRCERRGSSDCSGAGPSPSLVLAACVNDKDGMKVPALSPLGDRRGRLLVQLPFEEEEGLPEVRVGMGRWPCHVRTFSGLPPGRAATAGPASSWYAPGERPQRPREILNPSTEPMPRAARVVAVTPLGRRRNLAAEAEVMGPVGDALHAFLAADPGGDAGSRSAKASRLLSAHGVSVALDPGTLLEASDSLRSFLDGRFPGAAWFHEWPVRARTTAKHPRLVVGEVDLILELPGGLVLVDHKSFPGGQAERDERLPTWAQQLGWYAQVLATAMGKPLRAAFIHLPIRGEMAEVDLSHFARPGDRVERPVTPRDPRVL